VAACFPGGQGSAGMTYRPTSKVTTIVNLMVVTHSQENCASFLRKFLASNFRATSCKFG